MASFEIHGGKKLKGEVIPQGAKNEALQILRAVLLTPEKVTISNLPDIIDVNKLINLLQAMGVKIEKVEKGTYIFQAKDLDLDYLKSEDFKDRASGLRGSVMIIGPESVLQSPLTTCTTYVPATSSVKTPGLFCVAGIVFPRISSKV